MPTEQHITDAEDRISWSQLIIYGMGGFVPIALFNSAGQLLTLLGNIELGLSAFWLGVIMVVPKLWDAVSDPLIGHLSDNTRSRWGRRRPFILWGGIAAALSFVALWWVPRGDAVAEFLGGDQAYQWFQLAFVLGTLLVFYTSCTIFEIPHGALGMEMSADTHERTRLFSAKSFLGNLFAIVTPWLLAIASWEVFRGPGGDSIDGMRYVSMLIAGILIPLSCWWFFALREPGFAVAKQQQKSTFGADIRTTLKNKTFLSLVMIVFTLALGFNLVGIFGNYIAIFYLYQGDIRAAGPLLGVTGTVWAVTALLAVVPLNWLSRHWGKKKTLLIAILLMCTAQLTKIVCYSPQAPYLILIPTILLSTGMLMFFTLGSSMVGDICDEDDLHSGTRSEGSYYSVYWWFIKMGTAFASLVTGMLLIFTSFDSAQNVSVGELQGHLEVLQSNAESWGNPSNAKRDRKVSFDQQVFKALESTDELKKHFNSRLQEQPVYTGHTQQLLSQLVHVRNEVDTIQKNSAALLATPKLLSAKTSEIIALVMPLKQQAPETLFRFRLVEISLPLLLSIISIWLTLDYSLTEERCHDIHQALKKRNAQRRRTQNS